MYKISITLNKKSKTVLISKQVGDVWFQIRKQVKKQDKVSIPDIEKELDQEINKELLLG